MSKGIKLVLALALLGGMAACAQQEEVVVQQPVVAEPTYNKF